MGYLKKSVLFRKVLGQPTKDEITFSEPSEVIENAFDDRSLVSKYEVNTKNDILHGQYERYYSLQYLGNMEGKEVLIAGGGPGFYAEALQGACQKVVSLDVSQEMSEACKVRADGKVVVVTHDLSEKLPFPDDSFDAIVSPLTLQYVLDWGSVLLELKRVLRPGGKIVLSFYSPVADVQAGASYLKTQLKTQYFHDFSRRVAAFRRPVSACVNPFVAAGFALEQIAEPMPPTSLTTSNPEISKAIIDNPLFMFLIGFLPE